MKFRLKAKARSGQIAHLALFLVGVGSFLNSPEVMAGGTAFDPVSISGLGSANAGQAAEAGDASVMFANPAALTRFKRAELTQGAAIITIGSNYTSNQDGDGAPTNEGTRGSNGQLFSRNDGFDAAALAPNLYIAIPLSSKATMGFSAAASHGLVLHYDQNFPGRNQGRDIDFKVTRLNLGLGYKVSPTLSLGINGSYERYFQSIKLRVNYRDAVGKLTPPGTTTLLDLLDTLNAAPPIPDETNAKLRMFGWALNTQVGALWEPSANTRIGISYRPKTDFDGNRGVFSLEDTPEQAAFRAFLRGGLISTAGPLLDVNGRKAASDLEPYQRIKQSITLPDEFRLTIFHHPTPKLDLMASYTRQDFSVTNLLFEREADRGGLDPTLENIPQNFKAAQSYRMGMNYKLYKRLTVRAGFAKENGVIDDATRITILPDSDRKFYSLGGTLDFSSNTAMHFAYQFMDTKPAKVGLNQSVTPTEVSGGAFNGTVQLDTHFFGVGITERF
ncbi:MAG: outer membrane protein transport protein [Limnobacter sp.]|nr:outer membrane protein transport protein [Limnobacter sp.]